jgi:NAD-dependent dihydropyrimidine dehydrogenase PreA subunit
MKMVKITLDHEKCEGADCAECVDVCPIEVLIIDGENIVIRDVDECILCEVCMGVCPNGAVKVEED